MATFLPQFDILDALCGDEVNTFTGMPLTPPPLSQRGTALENGRDLLNFLIASLFINSLACVQ